MRRLDRVGLLLLGLLALALLALWVFWPAFEDMD